MDIKRNCYSELNSPTFNYLTFHLWIVLFTGILTTPLQSQDVQSTAQKTNSGANSKYEIQDVTIQDTLFGSQRVINKSALPGPKHTVVTDLDGDGRDDILTSANKTHKILWYQNHSNGYSDPKVIDDSTGNIVELIATDINNDNYPEAIAVIQDGNQIVGYGNSGGSFGAKQIIDQGISYIDHLVSGDFDNDGDQDLAINYGYDAYHAGEQEIVSWYSNTASGFGSRTFIDSVQSINYLASGDVNMDGYEDLIVSSDYELDERYPLLWMESGASGFNKKELLLNPSDRFYVFNTADLGKDGDLDILAQSWDRILLYRKQQGSYSNPQLIDSLGYTNNKNPLIIDQLDSDSDLDIAAIGEGYKLVWYEQNAFGFTEGTTITDTVEEAADLASGNLDGSGGADLATVDYEGDNILLNYSEDGQFATTHLMETSTSAWLQDVKARDMNNDGAMDVVAASAGDDKLSWYANTSNGFSSQKVISAQVEGVMDLAIDDLDGDNDLDIVTAGDHQLSYFLNNGTGFSEGHVVDQLQYGEFAVIHTVDMDGDNHIDLLTLTHEDSSLYVYPGNSSTFSSSQRIGFGINDSRDMATADLDGDGDLDVVTFSDYNDGIFWYENTESGYSDRKTINEDTENITSVYTADIGADGDQDIIVGADREKASIAMYENTGSGFSSQFTLADSIFVTDVMVKDLNNDGYLDIVAKSNLNNSVVWLEQNFLFFSYPKVITREAQGFGRVDIADMDGDSDLDIVSSSALDGKVAWYENSTVGTSISDGNRNGPEGYTLHENFPNPFNPSTEIRYELPKATDIRLTVYNSIGRRVATLVDGQQKAGQHHVTFDGTGLSSGVYFYTLETNSFTDTKKMMLMK